MLVHSKNKYGSEKKHGVFGRGEFEFLTRSLVIQCRPQSAIAHGPEIRTLVKFTLM